MFDRILILCVGNICRSPMAEALTRAALVGRAHPPLVHSAGVAALPGAPADPLAQSLLAARGLDLSVHRARALEPRMVRDADLILVMEEAQRRFLLGKAPAAAGKTWLLGHWTDTEIADPYMQPRAAYEQTLVLIDAAIAAWLPRLAGS